MKPALWIVILLFGISLHGDSLNEVRKSLPADFRTQHFPEEGYFQGWNFSFQNETYRIFATFLVSNFGPGSKNNGISMILKNKDEPTFYTTREFDSDDYVFKKDKFFQQSGENWMDFKDGKYYIHMVFPEYSLDFEYTPNQAGGVALSGGKYPIGDPSRFVQADIPLSFATVRGAIYRNGVQTDVQGIGGIEHMMTNYEIYNYSKKWEIVRGITKDGVRVFTGGFIGNEKIPGGFFRKVAILSKSGDLLLEGTVKKTVIEEIEKEKISGFQLPKREKLYFGETEDCFLEVRRGSLIAGMSALENISSVLRFFIGLFFAKPYQIHNEVELAVECPIWSGKAKGFHSYYLINE